MQRILFLENPIQTYAWGSHTALAELLGLPSPSSQPQAELWMGAHPKAPSKVILADSGFHLLNDIIAREPESLLGSRTASQFSNRLPYLFKVLAVEQPLSIQAHPSRSQARAGFDRENRLGIPLDAPHRNYKDDNHKPECICALTPFWALCGFRPIADMLTLFSTVRSEGMDPYLKRLEHQPDSSGLKDFFKTILSMTPEERRPVIAQAMKQAQPLAADNSVYRWMVELHQFHENDMGIFAPILLNLVRLSPGQALFLPAGELHAYLHGVAVELMANSDNVLRGGLTPKHVDVPELMKTLLFREQALEILLPEAMGKTEKVYRTPSTEFTLSVISVRDGIRHHSGARDSIEILLCVEGAAVLRQSDQAPPLPMAKGVSVCIPAAVGAYSVSGDAVIYKAAVPSFS